MSISRSLREAGVRHCHWKSNYHLSFALAAIEDFDVLVARDRFAEFCRILFQHDFRSAETATSRDQPGVFHFLGTDPTTGRLLNIHAYTRILTGDHLLKSYALPLERLLLENTRDECGVNVPLKSSEMIVFVLRLAIKLTSAIDRQILARTSQAVREEFAWLTEGYDSDLTARMLEEHFPSVEISVFQEFVTLLQNGEPPLSLRRAGRRITKSMARYRRFNLWQRYAEGCRTLLRLLHRRYWLHEKSMSFQSGGFSIALIGPQASGKSTLADAIRKWLGAELAIRYVHVGKPPSSWVSFLPNKLVPLARRVLSRQATRSIDATLEQNESTTLPWAYVLRKVLLAYDRRKLLAHVHRITRSGTIVLCDRYPSERIGAIDGPSFTATMIAAQSSKLKRAMMRWELRLYASVTPPDIVVQLEVPVEEAVRRNLKRCKAQPQDTGYVRQRHAMKRQPEFRRSRVIHLSTDRALDETVLTLKRELWAAL